MTETTKLGNFGKPCDHTNFKANCDVTRLTEGEGGPVTGYRADLKIECEKCGLPFVFPGVPFGYTPAHPTVSVDQVELRLPIKPLI